MKEPDRLLISIEGVASGTTYLSIPSFVVSDPETFTDAIRHVVETYRLTHPLPEGLEDSV